MPVASATDGGHRDCPVLASVAQWPEIQSLVSRGQIVSGVLPLLTDRQTDTQTDNYNFSVMIVPEIIAGIKHCNLRVSLITYASPAQPARSRRSRSLHGPRARTLHARPVALALPARAYTLHARARRVRPRQRARRVSRPDRV